MMAGGWSGWNPTLHISNAHVQTGGTASTPSVSRDLGKGHLKPPEGKDGDQPGRPLRVTPSRRHLVTLSPTPALATYFLALPRAAVSYLVDIVRYGERVENCAVLRQRPFLMTWASDLTRPSKCSILDSVYSISIDVIWEDSLAPGVRPSVGRHE